MLLADWPTGSEWQKSRFWRRCPGRTGLDQGPASLLLVVAARLTAANASLVSFDVPVRLAAAEAPASGSAVGAVRCYSCSSCSCPGGSLFQHRDVQILDKLRASGAPARSRKEAAVHVFHPSNQDLQQDKLLRVRNMQLGHECKRVNTDRVG